MKSTFTIDFADLTGNGIEPIIRVYIGDDGVEDKLLSTLFQSTDKLEVNYVQPDRPTNNLEERPNSYLTLSKAK